MDTTDSSSSFSNSPPVKSGAVASLRDFFASIIRKNETPSKDVSVSREASSPRRAHLRLIGTEAMAVYEDLPQKVIIDDIQDEKYLVRFIELEGVQKWIHCTEIRPLRRF